MTGILAMAGLAEAAFFFGAIMLGILATGTVFAVIGIVCSFFVPRISIAIPIGLGIIGLICMLGYIAVFWALNGDGAWEHACRHLEFHIFVAGTPFLLSMCAIILALRRRKRTITSD